MKANSDQTFEGDWQMQLEGKLVSLKARVTQNDCILKTVLTNIQTGQKTELCQRILEVVKNEEKETIWKSSALYDCAKVSSDENSKKVFLDKKVLRK